MRRFKTGKEFYIRRVKCILCSQKLTIQVLQSPAVSKHHDQRKVSQSALFDSVKTRRKQRKGC